MQSFKNHRQLFIETRYVIISPARNESAFIEFTINSVINQTIKPLEYIIVNDGSIDDTADIVSEYSKTYSWIKLFNLPDRGHHEYGSGVMEAFYYGFSNLTYSVLCKKL